MIFSPLALESGGLGVGLERDSGGLEDWVVGHGERRGSWEGMGGLSALPFGLTVGLPFWPGELSSLYTLMGLLLPNLGASLVGLSTTLGSSFCSEFSSQCRSPREWERFHGPVGPGGPSRSSQLRLAGMGDFLWALRRPNKLKPFREGLMKKGFGNFTRWFLLFCCKASVERVMGSVG